MVVCFHITVYENNEANECCFLPVVLELPVSSSLELIGSAKVVGVSVTVVSSEEGVGTIHDGKNNVFN
jgi:hypothetical protein